jgi:hypothetical protein
VALEVFRLIDDNCHPRPLSLLLSLIPRSDNRLLLAALNSLSALFSFGPLATAGLRLRGWDVLCGRCGDLVMDFKCEANYIDDAASGISSVTEFEGFSAVRKTTILTQLLECLTFLSSASEDASELIFDGSSNPVPEALSKVPHRNCVGDLLFYIDTILLRANEDVSVLDGINALTILYNIMLHPPARVALVKEKSGIHTLLLVMEKYLPGTVTQFVSATDQLDVCTLVMGILSRILTASEDTEMKDGVPAFGIPVLTAILKANIIFAIQTVSAACVYAELTDVIIFHTHILSVLSSSPATHAGFYTDVNIDSSVTALGDMLNCPLCSESDALTLILRLLTLMQSIVSVNASDLPPAVVAALLTFRSSSTHATDPKVAQLLDAFFVVAVETCD